MGTLIISGAACIAFLISIFFINMATKGYGAFSYGKSQALKVIAYVKNQETHHRKITFLDEYKKFLEKFEVNYDERYIFKALETFRS